MAELQNLESVSTSLADPALLEKFDKLFACNVGDYVSLPQLIPVQRRTTSR